MKSLTQVRLRLCTLTSKRYALLLLGIACTFTVVILATSFQFTNDHRWYWAVAPLVCVVVMLIAALGGLLIGRSFAKSTNISLWMIIVGTLLGFVWITAGMLAASLGALGMYQLPLIQYHLGWDTYSGSFVFNGSIRFLQLAAATGFVSGLTLGLGWARRQVSDLLLLRI